MLKDSSAMLFAIGDTVLHYLYKVDHNDIQFRTIDEKKTYNDSIIILDENDLELSSVLSIKGPFKHRKNNTF
ncbi:MAG: hypothetical protein DI598_04065 [Pseudopedobacter saltans]|uniref:Uncharacterized protein n=1 Tax=Pseudopedobacter saltans TaxID=151895 RepID=A0A2W5F8C5_9SPHI|nr:MAG: hypothetical protein DI598_04065 [Pseudopedobacter saltans]